MRPLAMVIFMIYQKKKRLSACPQQMYRDGKDERSVASQAVQITCAQKAISAVWSASSSSFYKMLVHHVKGDLATQYNVDVVVRQQLPRKQVVRKGTFTCVFWSSVSANRQDAKKKKTEHATKTFFFFFLGSFSFCFVFLFYSTQKTCRRRTRGRKSPVDFDSNSTDVRRYVRAAFLIKIKG